MTTDEFIKKQEAKIAEIMKVNKPLEIAVRSIMTMKSKRIFIEGKNANGGLIGEYSKKELYASPKGMQKKATRNLPGFPLKGKAGETKFKNGNSHKTGYFENYLAFKKAVGLNKIIQTVDLHLTGTLMQNWANGEIGNPMAKKLSANNYIEFLRSENYNKIKRYPNVFTTSKNERSMFLKVIQVEFTKAMKAA